MKPVIEILEKGLDYLSKVYAGIDEDIDVIFGNLNHVEMAINAAVAMLKAPRWETPEQREKRTGKPWPDDWAVYYRFMAGDVAGPWLVGVHRPLPSWDGKRQREPGSMYQVICAGEAGPPPDDWEPETQKD